jgi:dihydrouridine synthase duS
MVKVSLAPMVDRTDIHFRNFIRMINKDILLFTEMITTPALINGDSDRLLRKTEFENPVVLQIASSSLEEVKKVSKILKNTEYDEININVGCPSDRVSNFRMGAYLMSDPELVRDMVKYLREETGKKISIKNRIGIDGRGILEDDRIINSYQELMNFIDITNSDKYIIHARCAILKGLSPKENRTIPPLDYETVYRVKKDRPSLFIEINGGIRTIEDILLHKDKVDSIMIGRALYDNPMLANEIGVLNGFNSITHLEVLEKMYKYLESLEDSPHYFLRHTLGLFYNTPYSKIWKKYISGTNKKKEDLLEYIKEYERINF